MSLKRLNLSARSYTVREFYLRSGGEEYTDEAAAVRYSGLSRRGRLGFDGSILATYVSRLSTLEEEAELYLLINFGGEPQTEEDRKRAAVIATREG